MNGRDQYHGGLTRLDGTEGPAISLLPWMALSGLSGPRWKEGFAIDKMGLISFRSQGILGRYPEDAEPT